MGINIGRDIDEIGDEHVGTSFETPLREDAFEMDDELKIELIEKHFKEIMNNKYLKLETRFECAFTMTSCIQLSKEHALP
jgi:hypothetical protein